MNKYKIGKYIVKADSICDAVTIVKTIKNSVKDKRVFGFGNFPYEYWLKNNDGGWFLAAFSKRKYERTEIEALRKKYTLKNGKLPDYQEKIVDSVKDGKYVSELKPGDVITKKDGSKWDVVLVRHTPFGIQVRMNSKTSPVKTEEITYRPTDMLVYDSVKDSVTVRDIIQSLVTEETSAISSYNVALETLKDHIPDEAYEAIKAIRDDEQRHVENLYAVLNGNVTPKNLEN